VVAPYRARYATGLGCLAVATGLSLLIPWTVKHAIDALATEGAAAPLGRYVAIIVLCAVGNFLARLASRFAIAGAAQHVAADLLAQFYGAVQTFSPAAFARYTTGDLMARATSDVSAVRSLVGFGAISAASTTLAFVGALTAMLAVDPWLTVWAMAPSPALVLLVRRYNALVTARTHAMQERLGELSTVVQERLAGMGVVRAYTMEARAVAEFAAANAALRDASALLARTQAHFTPLMGLVTGLGTLVILWIGGTAVASGRITLGALVAFTGYLGYLAWPTAALGFTLALGRRGLASMQRIEEVIAGARGADEVGPHAPPARAGAPALRFSHLTFAYPGRDAVLRDVSFDVRPGEVVAVVGPTGGGKTTLGLLLARLWEPPAGTVYLGGDDVTTLPPRHIAAKGMARTFQHVKIRPNMTLIDNVLLGTYPRTRSGLFAGALRLNRAEEASARFEALQQLERVGLGDKPFELAGNLPLGNQRVLEIARALAADPALLVLDEPAAGLRYGEKQELAKLLRQLQQEGISILLVEHDMELVMEICDRIHVLDFGRIICTGTPAEVQRDPHVQAAYLGAEA